MKKQISLCSLLIVLFAAGCTVTIQPPEPDSRIVEIAANMTQTALPTATSTTPSITQNAVFSNDNTRVLFRDDFDRTLEPGWQWENENATNWRMDDVSGTLQIQCDAGYINLGSAKNLLLLDTPAHDFSAETGLSFMPIYSDQFAGLVLLASESDFIQAGLGYCSPVIGCIKNGFYIERYKGGKLMLPRIAVSFDGNSIAIRMSVQGEFLTVFTSPNGKVWYRVFEQPLYFSPEKVGIFTGQNNQQQIISATFGYFEISSFGE